MTRKAFIADVTSASEKPVPNIRDVKRGDDDGDVNFVFVPASGEPMTIALLALGTYQLLDTPTPFPCSLFSSVSLLLFHVHLQILAANLCRCFWLPF
jgi:hypothetical protein